MIYESFRVAGTHEAVLDNADLFISVKDDDIQDFYTRWHQV